MSKCAQCGGTGSWYGLAPHTHGFDSQNHIVIGGTKIEDKSKWPKNFTPDPDADGCGIWLCEACGGTGENRLKPYDNNECRHERRFYNHGELTCQDCGAVYDERKTEWKNIVRLE